MWICCLLVLLLVTLFCRRIMHVSVDGDCGIENDCQSKSTPCSLVCPFTEENRRLANENLILLHEGVYDLRNFSVHLEELVPYICKISMDNVIIKIRPFLENSKVEIRNFPYPSSEIKNGTLFFVQAVKVVFEMKGFLFSNFSYGRFYFPNEPIMFLPYHEYSGSLFYTSFNSEVKSIRFESMTISGLSFTLPNACSMFMNPFGCLCRSSNYERITLFNCSLENVYSFFIFPTSETFSLRIENSNISGMDYAPWVYIYSLPPKKINDEITLSSSEHIEIVFKKTIFYDGIGFFLKDNGGSSNFSFILEDCVFNEVSVDNDFVSISLTRFSVKISGCDFSDIAASGNSEKFFFNSIIGIYETIIQSLDDDYILEEESYDGVYDVSLLVSRNNFSNIVNSTSIILISLPEVYQVSLNVTITDCRFTKNTHVHISTLYDTPVLPFTSIITFFQIGNFRINKGGISIGNNVFSDNSGHDYLLYFLYSCNIHKMIFFQDIGVEAIFNIFNSEFTTNQVKKSLISFFPMGTQGVDDLGMGIDNDVLFRSCIIRNNRAGGSIISYIKGIEDETYRYFFDMNWKKLIIIDSEFDGNSGNYIVQVIGVHDLDPSGHALKYLFPSFYLTNTKFSNNKVIESGGAIYVEKISISVRDVHITNNHANKFGGGVLLKNSFFVGVDPKIYPIIPHLNLTISGNTAGISGGGIYQVGSSFSSFVLSYVKESVHIENNWVVSKKESKTESNLVSSPVGYSLLPGKRNKCNDIAGKTVWSCNMDQIGLYDMYGTLLTKPTFEDLDVIVYSENGIFGSPDKTTHVLTSSMYRGEGGSLSFYAIQVPKPSGNREKVEIEFLGRTEKSEVFFLYSKFPVWLVVVSVLSFLLAVCFCALCCSVLLLSFFSFCVFGWCCSSIYKNVKKKDSLKKNFGKFSYDSLHDHYTIKRNKMMKKKKKKNINEKSFLVDNRDDRNEEEEGYHQFMEIVFDDHHIFKGDLNGKGTIFYFFKNPNNKRTKLYPCFEGNFKFGKREGLGMEYFEPPHEDKIKFEGIYKENERNGKGTEYYFNDEDIDGNAKKKNFIVGEWKESTLCGVVYNNISLEIVDVEKDIQIGKLIYPKYEDCEEKKISTTTHTARLYEGMMLKKKLKVVIKLFGEFSRSKYGSLASFYTENRTKSVERNLKILSIYKHPNIIQILGWTGTQHRGSLGYIMEQCVCSIFDFLKHKEKYTMTSFGINSEDKKSIMGMKKRILGQVATAMIHVSKNCGLIHRDIKSTNILLDSLGNIKITDFDFAIMDDEEYYGKKNVAEDIAGSPFHLAPECLLEEKFDSKADVYSFGILMFEVLYDQFLDDPFGIMRTGVCGVCKERIEKSDEDRSLNLVNFMKIHLQKCDLTPNINYFGMEEESEGEIEEQFVEAWLINLMKECCNKDPKMRPTFVEIVETFSNNSSDQRILISMEREDRLDYGNSSLNSIYKKMK